MNRFLCRSSLLITAVVCCACGDEGGGAASQRRADEAGWRTERYTRGDTTVVRTVGASSLNASITLAEEASAGREQGRPEEQFGRVALVTPTDDGGFVMLDPTPPAQVRQFDAQGNFVRLIGRRGDGPGEYTSPASVYRTSDGQLLIGEDRRVHVFKANGEYVREWSLALTGRTFPGRLIGASEDGFAHVRLVRTSLDPDSTILTLRVTLDGSIVDTIGAPQSPRRTSVFRYRNPIAENSDGQMTIPFIPAFLRGYSKQGYWMSGGDSAQYAVLLHRRSGGLLRIESDQPRVAVLPGERDFHLHEMTRRIRRSDPSTTPPASIIPLEKPPLKGFFTDSDGRIWVTLHQTGVREEVDTVPTPTGDPTSIPGMVRRRTGENTFTVSDARASTMRQLNERWVEPLVCDVFLPSGEFAGRVAFPPNSSFGAARGDKLWLILTDENDVQRVVRYRMLSSGGEPFVSPTR